jgi:hypothetical protein
MWIRQPLQIDAPHQRGARRCDHEEVETNDEAHPSVNLKEHPATRHRGRTITEGAIEAS